jgi:chromosome segregation ATPase
MKDLKNNGIVDLKNDPEAMLEKMINRNVTFQIVEYVSAAAAVGGTIAAGLGQSAIFAAAPLTFSVCLNLFNRRNLDQLTRQRTFADTTEIQNRLTSDIQALQSSFQTLPEVREAIDISELQAALAAVSESVSALEEQALSPVNEIGEPQTALTADMDQLRIHQIELTEAIESVKQQLANAPETTTVVGPDMTGELATLRDAIANLEQRSNNNDEAVTNLEPLRAELQAMLTPMQTQVSALDERLRNQPVGEGFVADSGNTEQVIELQGHLEGLNTKVDNAFVNLSDELAAVRGVVEGTQGQLEGVQQRITDEVAGVRGAVDHTQNQINDIQGRLEGVGGAVDHTQNQISEIQGRLEGVQQGTAEPQAEPIEAQMETALNPIKEHLNHLNDKIEAIPTLDPAVIHGQGEQLQALQGQLHSMGTRIDNVSAQVSTEMENLPNLVEEKVKEAVDSRPPSSPPTEEKKASKLFELDALLADLES